MTHGEATELDKGLVEKITDPLTHLVRNSCDHGIGCPKSALPGRKPETWHDHAVGLAPGRLIVIEVRDDGKGLSREAPEEGARARHRTPRHSMTDQEVWGLIFARASPPPRW